MVALIFLWIFAMPILMPLPGNQSLPVPEVELATGEAPVIRPAKVADARGMSALINHYASTNVMLARGPQYIYQHIQDYLVATYPDAKSGKETVVACGAIHVLWEDLAEIRSVATHPACQKLGLGKRLVNALVARCRYLGIPRVFVFTLAAGFFSGCDFREFDREQLPPAVWVECSKCPKFYRCDEICMLRNC